MHLLKKYVLNKHVHLLTRLYSMYNIHVAIYVISLEMGHMPLVPRFSGETIRCIM